MLSCDAIPRPWSTKSKGCHWKWFVFLPVRAAAQMANSAELKAMLAAMPMRQLTALALCTSTMACFPQDVLVAPHLKPQLVAAPAVKIVRDQVNPLLVRGIVLDENGAPILGANVTIDAIYASVGTDKTGAFRIQARREGTFVMRIRAIGFKPTSDTVTIAPSAELWINATLKPDPWRSACTMVIGVAPAPPVAKKP